MAWRLAKYPTAMEVEAELDKIRGGANAAISSSNTNISPRQQGGPGLFSRTPSYTYTPSILLYQQDSSPDNRASFVTAPPQVTGPYPQDLYRNSTTTIPKRRSPRRRRASKLLSKKGDHCVIIALRSMLPIVVIKKEIQSQLKVRQIIHSSMRTKMLELLVCW